jgi:hypothetical protein
MLRARVNAASCCGCALSCLCVNCECDAESSVMHMLFVLV